MTKASGLRATADRSPDVALYGVYEISKLLTAPGKLEVTLAKVLQLLSSFLDMRHGLIALLGENGRPEIVVGSGWSEATAKRYFDHLPERAIGRIVVTQMPLVVPDMKEDALFEEWNFSEWGPPAGGLAFVGVPIKDRGRVVGTLTIDREQDGEHHVRLDEDVRFLAMIANLVGQTVRLHRLVTNDRERLIEAQHRLQKVVERVVPNGTAPRRPRSTEVGESQYGIIGTSGAIESVLQKIRIVAKSHSTVLLRGESGTGKELFARALHDLSPRKDRPFVPVNCAALAESVLESELFGHEKGSFTGAATMHKGRFELADGGTLFLDEIGEISRSFQAKLLRVLQEGELERVGGSTTLKVNVRLVAATNRNLEEAVSRGDFRADLYYRISVVPIFLPPLRERAEDVPLLAEEFLRRFNQEHGTKASLTKSAVDVLLGCSFPGNVRELENCVRRTATLASGPAITADDFACRHDECMSALLWKHAEQPPAPESIQLPVTAKVAVTGPAAHPQRASRTASGSDEATNDAECPGSGTCSSLCGKDERLERARLIEAMDSAGWVQAKAARLLGMTPRQISYALRKFDIAIKKF
ncbi:MAG: nif-specific transcriptional activator NifA [Polyangiaceae bacterium]|jgi:Nif-specific regulatory protein